MAKKLPIRWSFKKGDRILYHTPKGREKTFIYGKQTWYGNSRPNRAFRFFRGKLEFREPTLSECCDKYFYKYSKKLEENLYTKNPMFDAFKFDWKQTAVAVPISYK